MKYSPKQNITLLSSLAHGFLNINTAEMMNDLEDSHARRPLPPIKKVHQLSTIFENPLDESSYNSDDPKNNANEPSGIISPPFFYAKRPKKIPKMTQIKIFPKRKALSINLLIMTTPPTILLHYKFLHYPIIQLSIQCPTIYPFPPPSF